MLSEGQPTSESPISSRVSRTFRIVKFALLTIAAVLYTAHFMHLRADFPNHSNWADWAKYTDEGWYGSAAIRHYQLGRWDLPGDFNPAAALPVWPLLELGLFHFTDVSLTAARALALAIFGLVLLFCYLLLLRWEKDVAKRNPTIFSSTAQSVAPAIVVLLLAASPFYFAFSRLAILEPLMLLLGLTALMIAQRAGDAGAALWAMDRGEQGPVRRRQLMLRADAWSVLLGLILTAMVLTKTTGIFLFPSIAWMLWSGCAYRLHAFLYTGAIASVAVAASWGSYMLFFVRPHHLADYRYLFSANAYTGITNSTFWSVIADTFFAGGCLGIGFFSLGIAAVVIFAVFLAMRNFRRDGLAVSLLLWIFFYFAFLAYHDNLQARYYYVLGTPLAMLAAMAFDTFLQCGTQPANSAAGHPSVQPFARNAALLGAGVAGAMVLFTSACGATQQAGFIARPEYTFLSAVHQLRDVIDRQRAQDLAARLPVHPETVFSISGADISFLTGLPSICDDFGTMTLQERIAAYKPGWYVAWNDVEDDKMEALAPTYRLVRAGAWPVFDDPDRDLLVLYRLDPLRHPELGKGRRRRALNLPRSLRSRQAVHQRPAH